MRTGYKFGKQLATATKFISSGSYDKTSFPICVFVFHLVYIIYPMFLLVRGIAHG